MKHIVLVALVFLLAQSASAQRYHITDLGPIEPVSINVWGQIAGNLNNHAVLWTKLEGMRDLGLLPGGTFSRATQINDLAAIAGTADGHATVVGGATQTATCTSLIQPFIWTPRKGLATAPQLPAVDIFFTTGTPCVQAIDSTGFNLAGQLVASNPAPTATYLGAYLWDGAQKMSFITTDYQDAANAINNFGAIVGQSLNWDFKSSAILWKNGVETALGALNPASKCSGATSINDLGQVVGWSATTSAACYQLSGTEAPVHAFLWEAAAGMRDLGTLPGDTSSAASRVSPTGVVIGASGSAIVNDPVLTYAIEVVGRPFIWSRERGMRDLNQMIDPQSGWTLNSAADINLWGQIVGTGTVDRKTHGFLLTPQ